MVSIKEIAALAGVSRGTVDRALNNRGDVNPDVARKIRQIADENGYASNRAARALAKRRHPKRIGVVLPAQGNAFFDDVLRGVMQAAKAYADYGVSVSIKTMKGYDVATWLFLIDELISEGIEGLVVTAPHDEKIVGRMNQLLRDKILVVTSNTDLEGVDRLCYVGTNYEHNGVIAAGLLGMSMPRQKADVAIFTGSHLVLGHKQRIEGFSRTLANKYPHLRIMKTYETQDDNAIAYKQCKALLSQTNGPKAIYVTAGGVAGICEAMTKSASFGNIRLITHDLTSESRPYLEKGVMTATICQDPFRQGYEPIRILFDALLDDIRPKQDILYTATSILIPESLGVQSASIK